MERRITKSGKVVSDIGRWVRKRSPNDRLRSVQEFIVMNRPGGQSMPVDRTARHTALRWLLAGLAAVAVGTMFTAWGGLGTLPAALEAVVAAACGWLTLILLAPWRALGRLNDDRPDIRLLADRLESCLADGRETPLSEIILDRNDEIGALSRQIHDLAVKVTELRRENRLMHRRMEDSIRRETHRATAHLQRQASTDPLTGLGNRRVLEQQLDELLGRDADPGRLLTVMAADLDHFKIINDTLGHEVGDRCLVFLADLLRSSLRREDCAIRLGGDEFIVLMPDRTMDEAKSVAARLRSLFAQMPWKHREPSPPTLSVGLASAEAGNVSDAAELIRQADAALYASKRAGRALISGYAQRRGAA
jgi:diguanylate cyclase (GGDEF)-like protein